VEKSAEELKAKIRRLRLTSRKLIHAFGEGTFRTMFHGRGIEFAALREYVPGDDIRLIDWNTTARRGTPYVKTFIEERDLAVMLAIDLSSSMNRKNETLAQLTALLTYLADYHDDRIGCLGFTDKVEFFLPPKKNPVQPERILHLVLTKSEEGKRTSISQALSFLRRVLKKHSLLFLISDFLDQQYDTQLGALARKHEIVGIDLHDSIESSLPAAAVVDSYDPETGKRILLDGYDDATRREYIAFFQQQRQNVKRAFARAKADLLMLTGGAGADLKLIQFLRMRQSARIPLQLVG
jgi:uncharacterized protein (DUF58 family)